MFERLSRSWALLQQSLRVLSLDPELLVFPLISAACFLAVGASFIAPVVLTALHGGAGQGVAGHAAHAALSAAHYAVLFAFYVATYFVTTFFNVALVACAGIRLRGGDPTVGDGFRAAGSRFGQILSWVVAAATVGMVLHAVEERANGLVGKVVSGLLGLAWSLATVLVVPVLAFEQVGPVEALKRSVGLVKQTWGEEVVGNAGLGLVSTLGFFVGLGVAVLGLLAAPHLWGLWLASAAAILGVAAIVQSTLHGIYQAAVYAYATTGQVPEAFSAELVQQAYRPR